MSESRYHVELLWKGAMDGEIEVEGLPSQTFSASVEHGGKEGTWTPKQYLVGAIATCFGLTFRALLKKAKVDAEMIRFPVEGVLTEHEDRTSSFTQFLFRPEIKAPADQREKVTLLLKKAEKYCLVSRSLKGEVLLEPKFL